MEAVQDKQPGQRRRRVIVAIAVLAVAAVWFRNTALERKIVGRWTTSTGVTWHFDADGTFFSVGTLNGRHPAVWSVSQSGILVQRKGNAARNVLARILHATNRSFGLPKIAPAGIESLKITRIDGDTLVLDDWINLTRVPEPSLSRDAALR